MASSDNPRATTKAGHAYLVLRRAIVTGEIKANEPIDEAETCMRYGFGRTPCREAVKRLALEHIVVWPARRSPYVRAIDALEQERLDEARLTLETRTAELAATRATPAQLEALYEEAERMREHLLAGETYEAVLCDYSIHHGIALASDNRFLAEAVAALDMSTMRQWYAAMSTQDTSRVADGHRAIIDAIAAHDATSARELTAAHVHESFSRQEILRSPKQPSLQQPEGGIAHISSPMP